jgi:nitrite reductase/ring-hydroxylating ferredoxin subunit/uncharacterized membrane protein
MNPEISSTERPVDAVPSSDLLGRMAAAIQPPLQALLEGDGPVRRPLKDLLHGTVLGHPLHPLLTDIPIGAWSMTALFDVFELFGSKRYRDAADLSLLAGVAGALASAVTGLADWSDTKDEPQRTGMLHAIVNSSALACYLGSYAARRTGGRGAGIAVGLGGYALLIAGAYLGGELSFGMQLGVKHTAVPIEPPKTFVRVHDDAEIAAGTMVAADAKGVPLLLSQQSGDVCAVSGVCTHRGAPLADGNVEDGCVRCPWHGSRFSLETGAVVEGPATFPLAHFETKRAKGGIAVRPHRPD